MNNKGPIEVALSTDLRGNPYHFALWDVYTGAQIVVFKGSSCNVIPNCLQLIDNNYFITASDNVLNVWSIFNRKCQDQKLFLPARPSTICISPCGNYLCAGIGELIDVWQLHSGNLLASVQRHYQTVKVLKLNREGTFLISGGEDGMVLVWPFADLISATHNTGSLKIRKDRKDVGVNEPRFTWQHHTGQITDIHISNGGLCITTSTDKSVNIYSYDDGKRLYSVLMPTPIWSVAMKKNETLIYLGGQDGNIYEILTSSMSLSAMDTERERSVLKGHKDKVTNLIVSTDGSRLISGSLDTTCKIWDTYQGKMLQDIKHQAPLANLTTLLVPDALALTSITQTNSKSTKCYKNLKRTLHQPARYTSVNVDDLFEGSATDIINIRNSLNHWKIECEIPVVKKVDAMEANTTSRNGNGNNNGNNNNNANRDPKNVERLKSRMVKLYELSVKKIFKDAADEGLRSFAPLIDEIRVSPAKDKKNITPAGKRRPHTKRSKKRLKQ